MKGDFTRDTFDTSKHFTRVLMQQGRVQLDADWNEQAAILLHYLRALAADLIGPHGGPPDDFRIENCTDDEGNKKKHDFCITPGHYYVDGILCENDVRLDESDEPLPLPYTEQPDYPAAAKLEDTTMYLVYLDVWERHLTCIEDDDIREEALGGPDTATRAKVVWQVKVTDKYIDENNQETDIHDNFTKDQVKDNWERWLEKWQPKHRGQLKATAKPPKGAGTTDPCITPPEARYRGPENQLYRVEIHEGGQAETATFKWSRDNGSIVFPIRELVTSEDLVTITLEHLGRDDRSSLQPGDWVEIVDDDYILRESDRQDVPPLLKVKTVDRVNTKVVLEGTYAYKVGEHLVGQDLDKHPLLRCWDHREGDPKQGGLQLEDGAVLINEDKWLELEDGIQIQFQSDATYRPGDYWLIPARTTTGEVEWPRDGDGNPKLRLPHGVDHHYAPLQIVSVNAEGTVTAGADCRRTIEPLGQPVSDG